MKKIILLIPLLLLLTSENNNCMHRKMLKKSYQRQKHVNKRRGPKKVRSRVRKKEIMREDKRVTRQQEESFYREPRPKVSLAELRRLKNGAGISSVSKSLPKSSRVSSSSSQTDFSFSRKHLIPMVLIFFLMLPRAVNGKTCTLSAGGRLTCTGPDSVIPANSHVDIISGGFYVDTTVKFETDQKKIDWAGLESQGNTAQAMCREMGQAKCFPDKWFPNDRDRCNDLGVNFACNSCSVDQMREQSQESWEEKVDDMKYHRKLVIRACRDIAKETRDRNCCLPGLERKYERLCEEFTPIDDCEEQCK